MIERVDSLLVVKAIADVLGTTGDENRAAELLSAWSVDIHKGAYRAGLNAANKEPITCPRCLSDNIDLSCGDSLRRVQGLWGLHDLRVCVHPRSV
jgi:hypothetical protein